MIDPLTVLITGTNKGIGCDLIKVFLKMNKNSFIIATSRQKAEIAYKRWEELDTNKQITCKYLDLKAKESILELTEEIQKSGVRIDILVNNAGVCRVDELQRELPSLQWVQECLRVNVMAQIELVENLLPFLSDKCKIVNVCSTTGGLKHQPIQTQLKFADLSTERSDIIYALDQYIKETTQQKIISFSSNVYGTSKMLFAAWSRFVLRKQLTQNQISICVSPGLCLTQMTEGIQEKIKAKAHTSESGAIKIYQTIFLSELNPDIFYHRARKSDFYLNGEGLPRE